MTRPTRLPLNRIKRARQARPCTNDKKLLCSNVCEPEIKRVRTSTSQILKKKCNKFTLTIKKTCQPLNDDYQRFCCLITKNADFAISENETRKSSKMVIANSSFRLFFNNYSPVQLQTFTLRFPHVELWFEVFWIFLVPQQPIGIIKIARSENILSLRRAHRMRSCCIFVYFHILIQTKCEHNKKRRGIVKRSKNNFSGSVSFCLHFVLDNHQFWWLLCLKSSKLMIFDIYFVAWLLEGSGWCESMPNRTQISFAMFSAFREAVSMKNAKNYQNVCRNHQFWRFYFSISNFERAFFNFDDWKNGNLQNWWSIQNIEEWEHHIWR